MIYAFVLLTLLSPPPSPMATWQSSGTVEFQYADDPDNTTECREVAGSWLLYCPDMAVDDWAKLLPIPGPYYTSPRRHR